MSNKDFDGWLLKQANFIKNGEFNKLDTTPLSEEIEKMPDELIKLKLSDTEVQKISEGLIEQCPYCNIPMVLASPYILLKKDLIPHCVLCTPSHINYLHSFTVKCNNCGLTETIENEN